MPEVFTLIYCPVEEIDFTEYFEVLVLTEEMDYVFIVGLCTATTKDCYKG